MVMPATVTVDLKKIGQNQGLALAKTGFWRRLIGITCVNARAAAATVQLLEGEPWVEDRHTDR